MQHHPNCALLFGGICIQRLKVETCRRAVTSPRHRHPENCSDSLTLSDFARRPTGSLKPLHKVCDFDLMFHTHFSNGHFTIPNRSSIPSTHSFLRNAASPCATASYSELAVTSAVCEIPSRSLIVARHDRTDIKCRLP